MAAISALSTSSSHEAFAMLPCKFLMKIVLNFQVDIAYAPFLERFQLSLMDLNKYDIAAGRPKLAAWIDAQNDWIPNLIEKVTHVNSSLFCRR